MPISAFRGVLPQVLFLLPLRGLAAGQGASLRPGRGRESRDRVHRAGQRVRRPRRRARPAGDLRLRWMRTRSERIPHTFRYRVTGTGMRSARYLQAATATA